MKELTEKPCARCELILPIDRFFKQSHSATGYNSACSRCMKQGKPADAFNTEWLSKPLFEYTVR